MPALAKDLNMLKESSSLIGRYTRAGISELTFNYEPFLLTGEALIFGSSPNNFNEVMSIATVDEKDCAGHFGPKLPSGQAKLMVPLLHLSRCMIITAQIAARIIYPEMIPVPFTCGNIKANNQNLIPPPATVVAKVVDLKSENGSLKVNAFARANGEPYAEMRELLFKLISVDQFKRKSNLDDNKIPEKLIANYSVEKEFDAWDIEDLILERRPFQRLGRAILLRSHGDDLRLITTSKITQEDCAGQLLINKESTLSPIDYTKVMALTAELLASIVTRERFNDYAVVPIAVKVEEIITPNLQLLSPSATVIVEANISAENLNDPRWIRRGKNLFRADTASAWVGGVEVARMKNVLYALVQEDGFLENE